MAEGQATAERRQEAMMARFEAARGWWREQYAAALDRLEAPGSHGEIASTEDGEASIEWYARGEVSIYVADWEEDRQYTPDETRRLAFDLLALADLVQFPQHSIDPGGEGSG